MPNEVIMQYAEMGSGTTMAFNKAMIMLDELKRSVFLMRPRSNWASLENKLTESLNEICGQFRYGIGCTRCPITSICKGKDDGGNILSNQTAISFNIRAGLRVLRTLETDVAVSRYSINNPTYKIIKLCRDMEDDICALENLILEGIYDSMPEKSRGKQATLEDDK